MYTFQVVVQLHSLNESLSACGPLCTLYNVRLSGVGVVVVVVVREGAGASEHALGTDTGWSLVV